MVPFVLTSLLGGPSLVERVFPQIDMAFPRATQSHPRQLPKNLKRCSTAFLCCRGTDGVSSVIPGLDLMTPNPQFWGVSLHRIHCSNNNRAQKAFNTVLLLRCAPALTGLLHGRPIFQKTRRCQGLLAVQNCWASPKFLSRVNMGPMAPGRSIDLSVWLASQMAEVVACLGKFVGRLPLSGFLTWESPLAHY